MAGKLGNLKLGANGSITKDTLVVLAEIWHRYIDYDKLLTNIIQEAGEDTVGELVEVREVVRTLVDEVDGLLKKKSLTDAQPIIQRIKDYTGEIDFGIKTFRENAAKNEKLQTVLEGVEKKSDVSLSDLEAAQTVVSRGTKKLYKPQGRGIASTIKAAAPSAVNFGKEAIGGLLNSTLGPFAGIAKGAWTAGSELFSHLKERKEERQSLNFAKSMSPYSEAFAENQINPYAWEKGNGTGMEGAVRGLRGQSMGRESGGGAIERGLKALVGGQDKNREATPTFRHGSWEGGASSDEMYQFFNKGAYRARWTSEILDALKGKGASKGEGGVLEGLGMGAMLGKLKALGLALASLGGYIGLAIAPAAALVGVFKEWNKFMGSVDKKLHDLHPQYAAFLDKLPTSQTLMRDVVRSIEERVTGNKSVDNGGQPVAKLVTSNQPMGPVNSKAPGLGYVNAGGVPAMGGPNPSLGGSGSSLASPSSSDMRSVDDLVAKFSGVMDKMMDKLNRQNNAPIVMPSSRQSNPHPSSVGDNWLGRANAGTLGQEQ